jgi:hypothetical protein
MQTMGAPGQALSESQGKPTPPGNNGSELRLVLPALLTPASSPEPALPPEPLPPEPLPPEPLPFEPLLAEPPLLLNGVPSTPSFDSPPPLDEVPPEPLPEAQSQAPKLWPSAAQA